MSGPDGDPSTPDVLVVAPDKFKGSLTAVQAADRMAAGLARGYHGAGLAHPHVVRIPLADGGEGSVQVAAAAGWRTRTEVVSGPTGAPVRARLALGRVLGVRTALVELAQASGLDRLVDGVRAPLTASTLGTGQLVRSALHAGARCVVLGVGGSASTDAGAGLLTALGARLLDREGQPVRPGGADLTRLERIDLSAMDPLVRGADWVLASDVDSPLLGAGGSARLFGPQKGADADMVQTLERGLARFAEVLARTCGRDLRAAPGAGAAGGTGLAALAGLGATRRPGIDVMLELTRFAERTTGARLVVTGEGSFDEQSLAGKTPVGVARAAGALGVPVAVIAGRCTLTEAQWRAAGIGSVGSVSDLESVPSRRMERAASLVERLAATLGERTATAPPGSPR